MSEMRKFFLLFVAILSIAGLHANAQIKNTILNTTLGQTTKQRAHKIVENMRCDFSYTDETITCSDVKFAGYGWEKVVFYFYKNILYKIVFDSPFVVSEKSMKSWKRPTKQSDIMTNLYEAAKSKYSIYEDGWKTFEDGTTKLDFAFTKMTYENSALSKKVSKESLNDL